MNKEVEYMGGGYFNPQIRRETSSFRGSPVLPPPLPFFLASPCIVFDRISKIHIFGTKLQSCLETYYIK